MINEAARQGGRKGVFLDYASLAPEELDLRALKALPIEWTYYQFGTTDTTQARLQGFDFVLTNKVIITREHMLANPQMKLIVILATGTNNVDLAAAKDLGIGVANIVDYSTSSVVQHTLAVMLGHFSRIGPYQRAVEEGRWQQSRFFGLLDYPIEEVAGKRLGIIGYGKIGQAIAKIAEALGMTVLVAQSVSPQDSCGDEKFRIAISELLARADVVSIHCPLTEQSRGLISDAQLQLMKPDSLLINVARGGIVDEQALARALKEGLIGGAAIDVLAVEPPGQECPLLDSTLPNLILTPHTAWASRQARQRLLEQLVDILQSYESGVLVNKVESC
jgi:glycerate dehydrogenase